MAEFGPEVVRLFAKDPRSLRSRNQKLSRLFLLAVSAAKQQPNSRSDCNAEPCPQSCAGPSLFV